MLTQFPFVVALSIPTAYLFATGLGAAVWLPLFILRPDLRRLMVAMSFAGIPLAVSDLFYVPRYWRPVTVGHIPVGFEGVLFSFEAAGICAVLYPAVSRTTLRLTGVPHAAGVVSIPNIIRQAAQKLTLGKAALILIPVGVCPIVALGLDTNIEWGLYLGLLISMASIAVRRTDLAWAELFGGLAFLPIYAACLIVWLWAFPGVHDWFTLWHMPHWYLLGVPVEEIVFGAIFAGYWTALAPLLLDEEFESRDLTPLPSRFHAAGRTAWTSQTASRTDAPGLLED